MDLVIQHHEHEKHIKNDSINNMHMSFSDVGLSHSEHTCVFLQTGKEHRKRRYTRGSKTGAQ